MKWIRDLSGDRVRAQPERLTGVPVEIAREAYEEYAAQFGRDQSFERLHERGGFGTTELIYLLFGRIRRMQGEARPSTEIAGAGAGQ